MSKLTVKELSEFKYEDLDMRIALDFSEITPIQIESVKTDIMVSDKKTILIVRKWETAKFLNDDHNTQVDGNQYYDAINDTLKEYIALDRLRFKIEEFGKRELDDQDFTVGKKAWAYIIEHPSIALGEHIDNSFIAFDDIDECYKAVHPRSGQQGFNLLCLDEFYKKNIEKILVIKTIIDEAIDADNKEKAKARQEAAKNKRELEKKLRGVL